MQAPRPSSGGLISEDRGGQEPRALITTKARATRLLWTRKRWVGFPSDGVGECTAGLMAMERDGGYFQKDLGITHGL